MNKTAEVSVAGVPLPPQELLFMNASQEDGLAHGKRLINRIGKLVPLDDGLFLDIGCGWGRSAYGLLAMGFEGDYVGFDIQPKHMDWLKENFTSAYPKYRFEKTNIPGSFESKNVGSVAAKIDKLIDLPISTAIAFSVFTHVYEETILDYTKQVFEHLAPGRSFVFTAFLLNDEARALIESGKGYFSVRHQLNEHCFYDDLNIPKKVLAYSEHWLLSQIRAQGYVIDHVVYGNWCGRDSQDGQDLIVARRPA